jgi:hypothetical protein
VKAQGPELEIQQINNSSKPQPFIGLEHHIPSMAGVFVIFSEQKRNGGFVSKSVFF